jgi:hypothetical protein
VPTSVHCRMISSSHSLASCIIQSWMRLTVNYGDIFFFGRLAVDCLGQLFRALRGQQSQNLSGDSILSRCCIAMSRWNIPILRPVSHGEHRRCVIQHLSNRYLDICRCFTVKLYDIHTRISRSIISKIFLAFLPKIVDITSGLVVLPSPQFIGRLTLNNLYISRDVSRWIFSTLLLTNCVELTRHFIGRFSVDVLDIFSGVSPSV